MPDSDHVPLMFQAQVKGRSLIHKLEDLKKKAQELGVRKETLSQQAYDWAKQWQESCDVDAIPEFGDRIRKSKPYAFTWRMVTNSGQDEGVIRPVIGERGWAYFPGSSMKGAFLRACRQLYPNQTARYCGGDGDDSELHPGILRFHGGYPSNDSWLDDAMVDIIHPQESWQSNGSRLSHETPKVQISLYQPTFIFGISSTEQLAEADWAEIWQIWDKALERGIGSRVSAGYGQIKKHGESKLAMVGLSGQGIASRRINLEGEFRPNGFKAALRGHTRRLWHGITDEKTVDRLTNQLWGGIVKGESATVGLLGIAFSAPDLELDEWVAEGNRNNRVPVYETGDAALQVLVMQNGLSQEQRDELKSFVIRLIRFSMLLGGFGKSWRRADHRLFLPDYRRQMIGCHWEFTQPSQKLYIPTNSNLTGIKRFLETFHQKAQEFSWLTAIADRKAPNHTWREAWCRTNVQVWGRIAEGEDDSKAIAWLHQDYQKGHSIKQSALTGSMNQIGRIWHRMYPHYRKQGESLIATGEYIELLTIFPNRSGDPTEVQKTADFLKFLNDSTDFIHLW
jgi:CRISPR-associated protein Cmr6